MSGLIRSTLGGWVADSRPTRNNYVTSRPTASAPYQERDGGRLHWFGDRYWLLGGWWPIANPAWGTDVTTNEVWSSIDLASWTMNLSHVLNPPTAGPGARWRRRHTFPSCIFPIGGIDHIVLMGSDFSDGAPWPSDVWASADPGNANGWFRLAASSPWGPAYNPIIGVYQGAIHLMGGIEYYDPDQSARASHWRTTSVTTGGITWEQLPDMPFARSHVNQANVLSGRMHITGGNAGQNVAYSQTNDTWAYDGDRGIWRQMSRGAPFPKSMWNSTVAYDERLWWVTGSALGVNMGGAYHSVDCGQTWQAVNASVAWGGSHADAVTATEAGGIAIASGSGHVNNTYRLQRTP